MGCCQIHLSAVRCRNPFRVVVPRWRFPRVARSSQPWALLRNPFGILRFAALQQMRVGGRSGKDKVRKTRWGGQSGAQAAFGVGAKGYLDNKRLRSRWILA